MKQRFRNLSNFPNLLECFLLNIYNKLIPLELGRKIRDKRKAEKLSADELANKLKVSRDSLYKWEKGTKPSDPEDYLRLMNWLNSGVETVPEIENESIPDLSTREIISVLTLALKNESEARKEQAETLKIQVQLLDRLEKEMARKDIQATMKTSLEEVRAIVEKLSIGQNKMSVRFLKEFAAIRDDQAHQAAPAAKGTRKIRDSEAR